MMSPSWRNTYLSEDCIEVRLNDIPLFSITLNRSRMMWELRNFGSDEVIDTDQYRHDLIGRIHSGRYLKASV
jgi:hypothetical protein